MAGVGHLDIGIDKGGAQVFGHNPAVQQYAQILAQHKAKQDADNKYLADILAKGYDPSTLRNDADRQSYIKQYSDIKQYAIDIENEKDPMKKSLGLAQVRQQLGNLGTYAENSKKQGLQEHAFAQSYMQNPSNWDDATIEKYRKSKEYELNSDDTIKDFTSLQRRVDPDKVDKMYQSHKDLLTKNLEYDNGTQTPAEVAGKKGVYVVQSRGLPMDGDNGALESTLHWATSQPDVQKSLGDRYPNIQAGTPQATLALRVKQYMNDMGDSEGIYDQTKPVFKESYKPESPPKPSWLENYWLKHAGVPYNPNPPGQAIANQQTPAQTLIVGDPAKNIGGLQQGDPSAMEKFFNLIPKGQYANMETPKQAVDQNTGEQLFDFPAHINEKAVQYNKTLKDKWKANNADKPYKSGDDESGDKWPPLHPEITVPAKSYKLNPASPDYLSRMAQVAKEQNVNLNQLNQIEGVKGGHGQIQQAKSDKTTEYKIKGKSFKSEAVEKAAKASGMTMDEYIKVANK